VLELLARYTGLHIKAAQVLAVLQRPDCGQINQERNVVA
jgi:hypothetical protein